MVEAAGVEPDISVENAQLTDSVNAEDWHDFQECQIHCTVTVQSFPRITRTPKLHLQTSPTFVKEHSEVPS